MSFDAARRCTLVVSPDLGETLPPDWRLMWVVAADSVAAPLTFVAEPSNGLDPAAACEITAPDNPVDALARMQTARYCSPTAGPTTSARLILDAPANATARLRVVGFVSSLADSMEGRIVRSDEVTMNGGCAEPLPPVVFRAAATHRLGRLDVHLAGANLGGVSTIPIAAMDSSWSYSLGISSQSDTAVTARATIAAPLPEFVVAAAGYGGGMGAAPLPADSPSLLDPQSCFAEFSGAQDTTGMQPKDFALVYGRDRWHIFYTRQYQTSNYTDKTNTRRIGHAESSDQHLSSWTVTSRNAIQVRPGRIWDNLHVWAPSVVLQGITYYMFYTGVQLDTIQPSPLITTEIQRIGVATSMDLDNWTQDASPVYFNKKATWTFRDSTAHSNNGDGWQFRDAFVMPDPAAPGRWIMYFVTIDSTLNKYVVGVATTPGTDLRAWQDKWPLRRTSATFMAADRNESPHAFHRHGKWWLLYTSNHYWGDQITYSLNASSPSDSAGWTKPDSLKAITCGEHGFPTPLNQWHATEYLGIGSHEYLSAFADNLFGGGVIQFTQVQSPNATCPTDTMRLDCPDVWTAVGRDGPSRSTPTVSLALTGPCPARHYASLQLLLGRRERVHVAIYDVVGRRLRTLLDATVPEGSLALRWDGANDRGVVASSGVYFARATCAGSRSVVTIPLIR